MKYKKTTQFKLLKDQPKAYGGTLFTTRKARSQPRPLDTRNTMHLVLRSSKAKGEWAFWRANHKAVIAKIINHFARKNGVKILSLANVGNHLHIHLKLSSRFTYPAFIRAITSAITTSITGCSKIARLKKVASDRFWDYRPFTRVIVGGYKALAYMRDYMFINQLEGLGVDHGGAIMFLANGMNGPSGRYSENRLSGKPEIGPKVRSVKNNCGQMKIS
jgi:REP element-mobilizing transposase RayT